MELLLHRQVLVQIKRQHHLLYGVPCSFTNFFTKSTRRNPLKGSSHFLMLLHCSVQCFGFTTHSTKKEVALFLITINTFRIIVESIYLVVFLIYAPKKAKLSTIKLLLLLNVFGFRVMLLSTLYLSKRTKHIAIIGWICLVFNISVFAAPLFVIRRVIKTRSVEYMSFTLALFLTINAIMWFFYGLLRKDYYVALPNTLRFLFDIVQMVLYLMYRNVMPVALEEPVKAQELNGHIIDVVKMGTTVPSDPNHAATGGAVCKV